MDDRTRTLLSTTDAKVWAKEFCSLFTVIAKEDVDSLSDDEAEGLMLGWFSNAMGMADMEAEKRERERPLKDRLRELFFLTAGATSAPFMRDNPDYEMPSQEVSAAVESILTEQGLGEDAA